MASLSRGKKMVDICNNINNTETENKKQTEAYVNCVEHNVSITHGFTENVIVDDHAGELVNKGSIRFKKQSMVQNEKDFLGNLYLSTTGDINQLIFCNDDEAGSSNISGQQKVYLDLDHQQSTVYDEDQHTQLVQDMKIAESFGQETDEDYNPEQESIFSDEEVFHQIQSSSSKIRNRSKEPHLEQNVIQATPTDRNFSKKRRIERYKNRNAGKSYETLDGKVKSARAMTALTVCRAKCMERIPPEIQEVIFKEYWSLGSRDERTKFVDNLVQSTETKVIRKRTDDPDKKTLGATGKKKKFQVVKLNHKDFVNYSNLCKSHLKLKQKDSNGNSFKWRKLRWLRYRQGFPKNIFFKFSLDEREEFRCMNLEGRTSQDTPLNPLPCYSSNL
ncbi:unnamed protein product [Psylliodes chrysocephalus]|uniref:Uncharacterized protein n=1 Tax=Psylliodes chrysocephalus TaxID=3402493 RepID=A0A9P0GM64_9CUCU|nr:unnamed protein product [Psylliodes chrysocephala]